jgi:enolase-phosphatase E1
VTNAAGTARRRGVLLDIEGTTTPLRFVSEVLFPFARVHLRDYLQRTFACAATQAAIAQLRIDALHMEDRAPAIAPAEAPDDQQIDSLIAHVDWLMDRDRKTTGLKRLQGQIWKAGYVGGRLRGELYADVPAALQRLREGSFTVAIFSSGSVEAQRLLFRHSTAGDLTPWVRAYFDTTIGTKRDPASYRRIVRRLGLAAEAITFCSDSIAELDAARAAGLRTILCVREHAIIPAQTRHPAMTSFEQLDSFLDVSQGQHRYE